MLWVQVFGVSGRSDNRKLSEVREGIQRVVASVSGLEVMPENVAVHFISTMADDDSGMIMVEVKVANLNLTNEVLFGIGSNVQLRLHRFFPNVAVVVFTCASMQVMHW